MDSELIMQHSEEMSWQYDEGAIERLKYIGKGSSGEVFAGILVGVGTVALKYMKIDDNVDSFMDEADIARKCDHPNIIQTIGVCFDPPSIITELMSTSLNKFLQSGSSLSPVDCLKVAKHISFGMIYLESVGIVHLDLAARNILIGKTIDTIKITDFGLSRRLENKNYYSTVKNNFPVSWTAPEGIVLGNAVVPSKKGKLDHKSDVYNKMLSCWNIDPNQRPTFQQIHDFFCDLIDVFEPSIEVSEEQEQECRPNTFRVSNMQRCGDTSRKNKFENMREVKDRKAKELSAEMAGQFGLKTARGLYLRALTNVSVDLAEWCKSCEHWYIVDRDGKVALKNRHWPNCFLRANPRCSVDAGNAPPERLEWTPVKNNNGSWSLQSAHGLWLSAQHDGKVCTVAHPDSTDEQFWRVTWRE